jgi:hypothetical protein
MFSKKLAFVIVGVMFFLTVVAFMEAKPNVRDKRVYPIVKKYMPFKVEKSLGGLRILREDDPNFKETPEAINFYHRLQYLERKWAEKHLKLERNILKILDGNGKVVEEIVLKSRKEIEFVNSYFGVE